jgi:hypothetical protein
VAASFASKTALWCPASRLSLMIAEPVSKASVGRAARMKPRLRVRHVCVAVASLAARHLFFSSPGNVDFYSHKRQCENIVQAVKASGIRVQSEPEWQVTSCGTNPSLRPLQPGAMAGSLTGRVAARRTENAGYIISIVTSDRGHAGTEGYIYCDGELPRVTGDPYRDVEAPGDLCLLRKRINRHWWAAYNNLH